MKKLSAWSIAIPLILLSIGFILLGTLGYAMSPEWLSAQQIRDQARKEIPEPTYPTAPEGKQVIQSNNRQVCTQVPQVQGGFPPKISMQQQCTNIPSPTITFQGPSTDERKAWQDKVASVRASYETAVDQEAARISERQRSDLKSYVKDMIQISTGVLGLITGITALLIGTRSRKVSTPQKDKKDADDSESAPEGGCADQKTS